MKHISKLVLLVALVVFASCQNESTQEIENQQQAELRFDEKGMVVSDGEEDKELTFNEKSEELTTPSLTYAKGGGHHGGGHHGGGQNNDNNDYIDCTPELLETGYDTTVNVEVLNKPGTNGYFDVSIDGGDMIQAYCSDRLPSLGEDDDFIDFTVVSTYDTAILAGGEFENVYTNPQNFDKVNWILNNIDISEDSEYTYGHVQYAIWKLIEGPYDNDFTDYLTPTPGDWRRYIDDAIGDEIYDAAVANGEGYTPECGGKLGLLLIPADYDNVQAIMITKDLPEAECNDCIGDVNQITFKWDWYNDYRVRLYQRYENTCYAVKIFDSVVGHNDEMAVSGTNADGTFGKYIYVYVGNCYYTKFKVNCDLNIGPGYKRGVVEVVSGTSTSGGELCDYEPSYNWCWWW
ncbi:hypothetical protein [Winogradskyella marincola]|uniref:Uncharacterized protein n=1 Tax=Winogradskyella marincola TaxID=3037795 RepID=A0ABT6G0L8_9FLAO|nr:hypothetical protein [Winogradskyella sp. YYF002]MDG4715584.1 hypothetical protein [Winogradskyella sp. YYF002]